MYKNKLKYTIINTLQEVDREASDAISELSSFYATSEVVYTEKMNIHGCIGCNDCWLKTPGICSIKDDYEKIFIKLLRSDRVIFITETKLGFVSCKMKNILDRLLPMLTMYLTIKDGQMRHCSRYDVSVDMGLLFKGDGDAEYLSLWMERVTLNIHSKSFGAYVIGDRKELFHALGNN